MLLLSNDLSNNFETIETINSNTIIMSDDLKFLEAIGSNIVKIFTQQFHIENPIIHSIFETTFTYNKQYFHKIKLPYLYINDFLTLAKYFNSNIDTDKLSHFTVLKPLFITNLLHIVPFGQTNRFILSNQDKQIAQQEIDYIQQYYKYGQIKTIIYKDDILNLIDNIKKLDYNLLYIQNIDIKDIKKYIQNTLEQQNQQLELYIIN